MSADKLRAHHLAAATTAELQFELLARAITRNSTKIAGAELALENLRKKRAAQMKELETMILRTALAGKGGAL